MTLAARLQRLEGKHGPDDNPTILVVSNRDEAEEAEQAAVKAGLDCNLAEAGATDLDLAVSSAALMNRRGRRASSTFRNSGNVGPIPSATARASNWPRALVRGD